MESLQKAVENKSAEDVLRLTCAHFTAGRVAFASSLGAEDQVITHILRTLFPDVGIFTIDTGCLPQASYSLMRATEKRYGFRYDVLVPDAVAVGELIDQHGPEFFYKSIELRKACCYARKVSPLQKKLATLDAWITGLRQGQAATRAHVLPVERDDGNGLIKINPLAAWSLEDVWGFIRAHEVPYNTLHDAGYPSIGCAPCTRAVEPGADVRSGRWWWEAPEHKECGLHNRPNKG
ncbi:MAG: phosphoadenylyl-sulfate reductase [Candidatus Omnitrophica bacterium]|nr:phosphoadenylyl-sulfate reductase [Candidatus Omnitrophota bacterium]